MTLKGYRASLFLVYSLSQCFILFSLSRSLWQLYTNKDQRTDLPTDRWTSYLRYFLLRFFVGFLRLFRFHLILEIYFCCCWCFYSYEGLSPLREWGKSRKDSHSLYGRYICVVFVGVFWWSITFSDSTN